MTYENIYESPHPLICAEQVLKIRESIDTRAIRLQQITTRLTKTVDEKDALGKVVATEKHPLGIETRVTKWGVFWLDGLPFCFKASPDIFNTRGAVGLYVGRVETTYHLGWTHDVPSSLTDFRPLINTNSFTKDELKSILRRIEGTKLNCSAVSDEDVQRILRSSLGAYQDNYREIDKRVFPPNHGSVYTAISTAIDLACSGKKLVIEENEKGRIPKIV